MLWHDLVSLLLLVGLVFGLLSVYALLTSPFNPWGPTHHPFDVTWSKGVPEIVRLHRLRVIESAWSDLLAKVRAGTLILLGKFGNGHYALSADHDEIIRQIHQRRFHQRAPFIISGDHFSMMYPRSLGVFYHTMLDPRTALDEVDWLDRQAIYLKSLVYCLEVYKQTKSLSTTITPLSGSYVSLMHIYALASDTMYSLLFALQSLRTVEELESLYPGEIDSPYSLQTSEVANDLLCEYEDTLRRHFSNYWDSIFDKSSGLVKDDLLLSGTKDIIRRSNSFYDNVIAWRTHELAQKLGLVNQDSKFLKRYKQKILSTFWFDEASMFLEDRSEEARVKRWYSSDWLIATQTGFLKVNDASDVRLLRRAVDQMIDSEVDQPFGLRYHNDARYHRLYWPVRIGAKDYASNVIWSHWGMEYIKLLILLGRDDDLYRSRAEQQLEAYYNNVVMNRGYPEVYRTNGSMYKSFLYTSVRMTGWVVNYEQARMLYEYYYSG